MVNLLLDEHIATGVVVALQRTAPELLVAHVSRWQSGRLLGADDGALLVEASRGALTLVTYDCRTLPRLLKEWAEQGRHHGGVILVDVRTIRPSDIRCLAGALIKLARLSQPWVWNDLVVYLTRA